VSRSTKSWYVQPKPKQVPSVSTRTEVILWWRRNRTLRINGLLFTRRSVADADVTAITLAFPGAVRLDEITLTKLELELITRARKAFCSLPTKTTATMKFIIVTGFFASAADGALSTMRIGPKKAIRGHAGFEFGRPVDDVDVLEA
jgi:hypothetical protein